MKKYALILSLATVLSAPAFAVVKTDINCSNNDGNLDFSLVYPMNGKECVVSQAVPADHDAPVESSCYNEDVWITVNKIQTNKYTIIAAATHYGSHKGEYDVSTSGNTTYTCIQDVYLQREKQEVDGSGK